MTAESGGRCEVRESAGGEWSLTLLFLRFRKVKPGFVDMEEVMTPLEE